MQINANQLGSYIREQRLLANLSLRDLAARVGVSHVFMGEVERGKKPLPRERWSALIAVLPNVTALQLEAHSNLDSRLMHTLLRQAGPQYEAIGEALLRRARNRDMNDPELMTLLELLQGKRS